MEELCFAIIIVSFSFVLGFVLAILLLCSTVGESWMQPDPGKVALSSWLFRFSQPIFSVKFSN